MATDVNLVTLTGRLTRDPEVRYTGNGAAVCEFSMAVNRSWKGQNDKDWQEEAMFIDVTTWKNLAEKVGEGVSKGDRVLVTGRLKMDQWEDKESGQKRSKLTVTANTVDKVETVKRAEKAETAQAVPANVQVGEDAPF